MSIIDAKYMIGIFRRAGSERDGKGLTTDDSLARLRRWDPAARCENSPPGRADEGFDSNGHRIQSNPHDLLMLFPSNLLTMWPISTKVNYPRNDAADILDRVELFPTDLFSME